MKARINNYISAVLQESALIRESGTLFLASFMGSIFLFAANIILSKQFGPEGFGNFKTVLSLFLFLPAPIEMGAGATLAKYTAESGGKAGLLIKWFLKARLLAYVALGLLIFLFQNQMAAFFLKNASLAYLILPGLVLFLFTYFEIFKPVVQGFQNFKLLGLSQFLTMFFQGLLVLVSGYFFGIYYALIGWGLGYLLANIPNMKFVVGRKILEPAKSFDTGKVFLTYSLPVYSMIIPNFIGLAIIPILSLFFSQQSIGYYAFAFTFYSGVLLIPAALSSVIMPKISELHGSKDFHMARTLLKKILVIYAPIVIVGTIGTIFLSDSIVNLISPSYLPGLAIFKTLIIFALLSGYIRIYGTYLTALGRIKELTACTLVLNVALLGASVFAIMI